MSKVSKVDIMLLDNGLVFVCEAKGKFETCDYTDGYKNRCPYKSNLACLCVNEGAIEVALKRMKQAICDEMKRRGIK